MLQPFEIGGANTCGILRRFDHGILDLNQTCEIKARKQKLPVIAL